jgi:NADH-ubiquinone oxidoreductase chain 4
MGAWWVIVAHGVVSSGIFTIANLLYERSHSRRMLVNKGYSRSGPSFTIFWFIIIIINFAGPFTLNLLGEIYLIIRVVSISNFIIIPVALLSFFSAAYSLLLFTSTQHGVPQSCNILSISPDKRELNLIFGHIWPVILILLRLGI